MRLLPPDREHGWTPFAWLVYLSMFIAYPAFSRAGTAEWVLTLLALAAFLGLYFRGFWVEGRALWPILGAIALLGAASSPFNPGGTVFFVYAAAFASRAAPPRTAYRAVFLLALALAVEAALTGIRPDGWIPGILFTLLIGSINIHYAGVSRTYAELRQARQEVERLAKLAERERIARDLHDLLGHTLSLITLKSELAARLVARDPARATREMGEVEQISRRALAEIREVVRGYRVAQLAAELANARLACEAAGVELAVEAAGEGPAGGLASQVEATLALALREAVTNVVRHAGARRCRVRIERSAARVRLEVSDDGRGGVAAEGAGLAGMRERVEALGGRVAREGSAGTRLAVELPLAPLEAAAGSVPEREAAARGAA